VGVEPAGFDLCGGFGVEALAGSAVATSIRPFSWNSSCSAYWREGAHCYTPEVTTLRPQSAVVSDLCGRMYAGE